MAQAGQTDSSSKPAKSPDKPLKILSFDGGGIRGLSSIVVLEHLMERISESRGKEVHPWEEFDLICGTSTGGLIAIMLGRLRLSVAQTKQAYLDVSKRIFTKRRSGFNFGSRAYDFLLANGKFDSKSMEEAIKTIITEYAKVPYETLLKDEDGPCKVFVTATRVGNIELALFRSYKNPLPRMLFNECKVWEACRATSAAPTYFDPVEIGPAKQQFVDGGLTHNNPIFLALREASETWPDRSSNAVFVSIGTGSAPKGKFKGSLLTIVEQLQKLVIETENTNQNFRTTHPEILNQNRFFRFQVFHSLDKVGLEEYKEISTIVDATQTYLDLDDVQRNVASLLASFERVAPETGTE